MMKSYKDDPQTAGNQHFDDTKKSLYGIVDDARSTPVRVYVAQDSPLEKSYFMVEVRSVVNPHLWAGVAVRPDENPALCSPKDVTKAIIAAGGTAAEHLCSKYADQLDPDECAAAAYLAFEDLRRKLKECGGLRATQH